MCESTLSDAPIIHFEPFEAPPGTIRYMAIYTAQSSLVNPSWRDLNIWSLHFVPLPMFKSLPAFNRLAEMKLRERSAVESGPGAI